MSSYLRFHLFISDYYEKWQITNLTISPEATHNSFECLQTISDLFQHRKCIQTKKSSNKPQKIHRRSRSLKRCVATSLTGLFRQRRHPRNGISRRNRQSFYMLRGTFYINYFDGAPGCFVHIFSSLGWSPVVSLTTFVNFRSIWICQSFGHS